MKAEDYYLGKLVKDLDLDYPSTETKISTNDEKVVSSQFFKRDFFPKNMEFLSDSDPMSESKESEKLSFKETKTKKENKKKSKKEKLQFKSQQEALKNKKKNPFNFPQKDVFENNEDSKYDDLKSQDLVLSDLRRINEGYKSKSKAFFWGDNCKSLNDDVSSSEDSKLSHIDIHSGNDDLSKNDDLLSKNEDIRQRQKMKPLSSIKLEYITKDFILNSFNNQKTTILFQRVILEANEEFIDKILSELEGMFITIMQNKNGNYFSSDLFKTCNESQRMKILQEIYPHISKVCLNEYGTHPIQTLIQLSKGEGEHKLILSSFNDAQTVLRTSINSNGSYVIQKIINFIPEERRKYFNELVLQNIKELSMDMYGICVVKQFMLFTKDSAIIDEIFNSIINNFINVAQNQYGNYLIQFLLQKWWHEYQCAFIKKLIYDNFIILSCNQFSWYICDLYINLSNNDEKKFLMASFLTNYSKIKPNSNNDNKNTISDYSTQNKYCNNVVKKLRDCLDNNNKKNRKKTGNKKDEEFFENGKIRRNK